MSRVDAILKRLLALHPNKLIDLKLGRIERLLEELGRPQDRLPPVIHVAGTNGKGSTCAYLRAFLEAADKRVHVYSSPHLVSFRERIRLAGKLVSARRLYDALARCEKVNDGRPITYFEITTAAAFLLFSEIEADYLVLEVGLGGRFDATNVIDHPLGAVITPVSIDHVEFLGDTLAKIAGEKAGIIKGGAKAVVARQAQEAEDVIVAEARRLGVTPFIAGTDYDGYAQNGRLIYQDEAGLLDLPPPALAGPFQFDNASVAIAAVRHFELPVSEAALAKGLREVSWPARLMPIKTGALRDILPAGHELWLDGGHNEAGGAALAAALQQMPKRPLVLVTGAFANKDMRGYLAHFDGLIDVLLSVPMVGDRVALPARKLADMGKELGIVSHSMRSVRSALRRAAEIPNARVVICGSLHLAGTVLHQNKTPPA